MLRTCMSICTRPSFPILEWSDILFLFRLSGVLDELANCAFTDFLNKLFGILEQMYLFTGMCNDKVGIFPC